MMNAKKIFIIIIACICFIVFGTLTGTTVYYSTKYRKSVQRYEQLLELSRQRNAEYEDVVNRARTTNRELGKCIESCQCSIDGLRNALYIIRERYTEMENLLNSVRNSDSNIDSSNNNSTSVTEVH